ncbi:MAG: peptide deformylase [Planctomycetes bacterium]|nr:peptide deformylase [Planctomycetota bacterium]
MGVLDVVEIGHPVLRETARELSLEELASPRWQGFIDDLIETMRARDGAGLAANQVGEPVRICVIEVRAPNPRYPYKPAIPLRVLVNAHWEPVGDEVFENFEGCLSVPNLRGLVQRQLRARVRYLDRHGAPHDEVVAGLCAGTHQHELDHLNGILFVDRVSDPHSLTTLAGYERFHKAEFEARIRELVARVGS